MSQVCKKICVRGRVQGVFYRAFAQKVAKDLYITGWARNEQDGSVSLIACGDSEQLEHFFSALRQGPPAANVLEVAVTDAPLQLFNSFEIQR